MLQHLRYLSIALTLTAAALRAQDTRTVNEPVIPPACVTLSATFTSASATSGELEASAARAGTESPTLDTARIQQALDHCEKGHAVELAATNGGDAFLSGPLLLRAGVTLLIDKGVTLFGTRNPEFYALSPGSCGVVNDNTVTGCRPLITARAATGSAIMGEGVIDGQGESKMIVAGKPTAESWWDLAEQARSAGRQQTPHMIDTDLTDDFTLYRVTLRNSPNVNVSFHRGDGFTAWAVKIDASKDARGTDGIDVGQSRNVTITHSYVNSGDDDVAIKAGEGPTTHITISHNHFYAGHGLSIGDETSAGVSGILVQDLSLDGTDNGIRIKSSATHGGRVEDVVYDDICIRDSKYPITLDSAFSFPGNKPYQLPVYDDMTLRNIRISGGGRIQINGFDHEHRTGVTLDNVLVTDSPQHYKPLANHADITFGPGPTNIIFSGDDSTAIGKPVAGTAPSCTAKFVPFPR